MSKALSDLLGWHTLTGLIQATVPGVPDVLPPGFDAVSKEVLFDRAEYTVISGNRGVARKAKFGAPARKRGLRDVQVQPAFLLHFIEEIEFDARTMMALRKKDSYERDAAYDEFKSQIAYFNEYFSNLEKTIKLMTLRNPTLYFDTDGNLLPTSSGSSETVTLYSQPSGNTAQLNVFGTGNIIDATWASPSTDIPSHLRALKQAARALTGYPLKYAIYGKNIPSYLTANNFVQQYLARHQPGREMWVKDNEVGNLFDLDWVPGYEAFWRSGSDQSTVNYVVGDDEIIFTPEPNKGWWEKLVGTYPVPTNINIVVDAEAAFDQIKLVPGKFAYAQLQTRPIGSLLTCGNTVLYAHKVPATTFTADVTP